MILLAVPFTAVGCGNNNDGTMGDMPPELETPVKPNDPEEKPTVPPEDEETNLLSNIAKDIINLLKEVAFESEAIYEIIYQNDGMIIQMPESALSLTAEEIKEASLLDDISMDGYKWDTKSETSYVLILITKLG